jgi:multimeric flavodoxin WrbA
MNVVAINGSPREGGNTELLLQEVLGELRDEGIETEYIRIGGQTVRGCTGCRWCFEHTEQKRCVFEDDFVNDCIGKMMTADAILLGSPTYFADVTPELKALIDRAGYVAIANDRCLKRKLGAAVVAVRRGGEIHAFDSINHFFLIQEMIVPGSIYWNLGIGRGAGEVRDDEEGIRTMKTLGRNMAWLLHKLHG